jgi:RimJ/RimL family protein N-acetyltransferase
MKKTKQTVVCFSGSKVILRPVHPEEDLPMFMKWLNDPEVNRFIQAVHPVSLYEEKEYLEKLHTRKSDVVFAIETIKNPKFIGVVGLHGINLRDRHATTGALIGEKDCWGKGYGSEAKMFLLYHAFYNLNLRRISSAAIDFNERSKNCIQKTGYFQEGIRKEMSFREGRYWDLIEFGLFRRTFEPIWKKYQNNPEEWLKPKDRKG